MRFDGKPVLAFGDGWIEVDDDGPALLRGYNESLIELDPGEASPAEQQANSSTIKSRGEQALQANRDFLALTAPTNAQVVAQVKALTRQNNGLIRLALNRFEGTD